MELTAEISGSAGAARAPEPLEDRPGSKGAVRAILTLLFYQGFVIAINGVASPWMQKSFGLSQSGIARLFAWIAVSALGALILSRLVDRIGRRRVLLSSIVAMPALALCAAGSRGLVAFIVFEILLYSFAGANVSASIVMLAESLPVERRAKGQSWGGLAAAFGSGLVVLLMPLLAGHHLSWRWLLVIAGAGILLLPRLKRTLPESGRWQDAAAAGSIARSRFYDVFGPLYRRRAVTLLVCSLLGTIGGTATGSWTYYHAVSVVGLPASAASALVLICGGAGLSGFLLGAWSAERAGRVPTVVGFGLASLLGSLWYYWGPPAHFGWPALWLGAGFLWTSVSLNASMVATNSAVTELFPTALRGTMMGWFAIVGAAAAVTAQVTISVLAGPLGGLSNVVGWLALLGAPAAILFGLMIEETRGLSLEESANERAFDHARS